MHRLLVGLTALAVSAVFAQPVPPYSRPVSPAFPFSSPHSSVSPAKAAVHSRAFNKAALSDAELANLTAFTRLLGFVQYFHPSDQATNVNWDDFAIHGISQVLDASGPAALATTLQSLFQPVAPTVRVYPTGQKPALPPELQASQTSGLSLVQWFNFGPPDNSNTGYGAMRVAQPLVNGALPQSFPNPMLGFGYGATSGVVPPFWYTYSNAVAPDIYTFAVDPHTTHDGTNTLRIQYSGSGTSNSEYGYAGQDLNPAALQGHTITLSVAIQTQSVVGSADFFISTTGPSGYVFQDLGASAPQGTTVWTTYEVTANVPSDATYVGFGLVLNGSGTAWFSGVTGPGLPPVAYPVLNPANPYEADLGAGVSCFVPVALYADNQGTLPHAASPNIPSEKPYSVNDEYTRLDGVAEIWNAVQHFQPYFDVAADNWPAALGQALTSAATAPDEPAYFNVLRTLMSALHDGHASFLTRLSTQSWYGPPLIWDWIEGQLVVTYVPKSPESQQIAAGDVVLSIDGVPAAQALAQAEGLASGATPQWIRYWALTSLLGSGDVGSTITLVLESGGAQRTVNLTRTIYRGTQIQPVSETRPYPVTQLAPGIMYVDITQAADSEWQAASSQLAAAKGIIFDMRGYPSPSFTWTTNFGQLTQQNLNSEHFQVPINATPDQTSRYFDESGDWSITPIAPFYPARLVFLTDGRIISQAETLMGIVENYNLGDIVGSPTAGTNGNVTVFDIIDTYQMIFTGMRVLKQDGSQHHGVGIQPTIPVMRTRAGVAAGKDEILARALEVLQNPHAPPIGPWVGSAADGLPDTASPGSLMRITASPSALGLGKEGFRHAAVSFDGNPAPTSSSTIRTPDLTVVADAASIVAEVPPEVAGQTSSQVSVEMDGKSLLSFGVQISPVAPGLFSMNGTGRGTGLILNDDGTLNTPANPAPAGSTVTVFVTGLGTSSLPAASAMVGGQAARTGTATLLKDDHCGARRCGAYIPILEGSVFQLPVTIPANTPAGPASVFVLIDGVASQGGLLVNVSASPAG